MEEKSEAMEIDPVDDGPVGPLPPPPPPPQIPSNASSSAIAAPISREEEAIQAIEHLRGGSAGSDVTVRVAAANKLDQVAATLGPERTRSVCYRMTWL